VYDIVSVDDLCEREVPARLGRVDRRIDVPWELLERGVRVVCDVLGWSKFVVFLDVGLIVVVNPSAVGGVSIHGVTQDRRC